mgnify:CR=1 FL=1
MKGLSGIGPPRPVQFTGVRWAVYIKDRRVCYGKKI